MLIENAIVFCLQVCMARLVKYHLYLAKSIGPNIVHWGNPQFMVPAAENMLFNETKKNLFVW